ncbi:hypothetical protein C1T31_00305 [Hanstruepera neustonica]|uniref:Secretion system C-terminal sorting domain-containing protein n=1 Tax=Hanstruepera neustonica TaxID=1445657 RepID=A0A2K1E2W0_9FLAO|nr:T9SS type A sorting domain-containing protein [Hanstruepera neustonica]PNQ74622.1 hypothetical protein C1T31_00305 [Hanstruepera neustonica]
MKYLLSLILMCFYGSVSCQINFIDITPFESENNPVLTGKVGKVRIATDDFGNTLLLTSGIISNESDPPAYQTTLYNLNTLTEINTPLLNIVNGDMEFLDANADGWLDIVMSGGIIGVGNSAKIYINNGNNTFYESTQYIRPLIVGNISIVDIDDDGDDDMFFDGSPGPPFNFSDAYISNGNGTFNRIEDSPIGAPNFKRIMHPSTSQEVIAYAGKDHIYTVDGNLTPTILYTYCDCTFGDAKLGDLNNDSFIDVVIPVYNSDSIELKFYLGASNGVFTEINSGLSWEKVNVPENGTDFSYELVDVDQDADLDIFTTFKKLPETDDPNEELPTMSVFENNNGTFSLSFNFSETLESIAMVTHDIDADSDFDLIFMGKIIGSNPWDLQLNVFENNSQTLSAIENVVETIKIYPNPTTDFINIQANFDITTIEVYSFQGQKVLSVENQKTINIRSLPKSIYFLKLKTVRGAFTKKIIKQ